MDRLGRALVMWYSALTVEVERFGEELNKVLANYDVKILAGDFNTRHTQWCNTHNEKRKGVQFLRTVKNFPEHSIHAPQKPSFQAHRFRRRGNFGISTIDIIVAKVPIHKVYRIEGELAEALDY